MTGGANSKFLSRLTAVLFIGAAFAGCLAMISQGERSLFADTPDSLETSFDDTARDVAANSAP